MLKKSSVLEFSSPNENNSLHLAGDVSVNSNNSSLDVTVIAANDEKPLPQRESQRNQPKVTKYSIFTSKVTSTDFCMYNIQFYTLIEDERHI